MVDAKMWLHLKREKFDIACARLTQAIEHNRGKPIGTIRRHDQAFRSTASADRPNALWLSDFTYVPTNTWFVYVAFVIEPSHGRSSAVASGGRRMRAWCSSCS
ncbi:hypothetical protein [Bradyrhizobium sp. DASA03007]|uniref:hypothetical protein n=1 Tax=unclassified Bradyrhizobium TaxID=2631580 RepID=UPI003F6E8F9B